ncbi:MAG TPA: hypothetical protein VER11_33435 [Polyangiaceae bacterium]|nr:hypothetical protein [Polyangiaceae bacterium]
MGPGSRTIMVTAPPLPTSAIPASSAAPEAPPVPARSQTTSQSRTPDDEESYLDQPIELDPFEDGGNDDQEATDLVIGEEIDVLGESVGDNEPVELDLGTIVGIDDGESERDADGDTSFEEDPAVGLTVPDALTPDDGSEGLEDGSITVDESKFPTLEKDDGSEGIAAEREISLGIASDEARVPMAAQLWQALHPVTALEYCSALAVSAEAVVAGSSDLLWFRGDASKPLRVAVDGNALSDLVLVGGDQDIALSSTRSGQLFRRARFASQAEQLTRFREHMRAAQGSRPQLSFGGQLGVPHGRVLLRLSEGTLLEVLDAGERFERLEFDGKVLAVARESSTILLGRDRAATLLDLDRNPDGGSPLHGPALAVAQSAEPLLATAGNALALAERGRALLVSPDAGKTFRRVAGSVNTTAIAGARLAGNERFFAAVYRETSDQSDILLIDPSRAEAECIARLEAGEHASSDAIERGEWAKVSALAWHAPSGRLWAVGGFGVVSFGPGTS